MTRTSLKMIGHLANGDVSTMSYGIWKGVIWLLGPHNLVTIEDLELNRPKKQRRPMKNKLELL